MSRLVINADDLGYSKEINERIFGLIESGRITSATLLMNAPAVEAAASELRRFAQASFGVHLNVTEFHPLTRHPGHTALCNAAGEFDAMVYKVALVPQVREAIFAEWCAQIERAYEIGVPVSHIDAHHHVHTLPKLFTVLKRVQRRFGIRKVRLTRNMLEPGERLRAGLLPAKAAWNFALRNFYKTRTADGFTSFSTFHTRLTARLPWRGTIELMAHPGNPDYEAETRLLETDWLSALAPQSRLINYLEL